MSRRPATSPDTEPLHQHVSALVRQLRQQRGWTLDELARLSGVSRSMLSQVERGRANPTLAVAWRIARALDLSLSDLVAGAFAPAGIEIIRGGQRDAIFRDDECCRIRTLSPLELEKDVEFYEVILHPGQTLASAAHYSGTREFVTVLQGCIVLTSGEFSGRLEKGDSAQYRADVPHSIHNPLRSRSTCILVDIYASNRTAT